MIKGAIFDLDGTLLDSNPFWDYAPGDYLATLGVKAAPDLAKTIFAMTMPEAAAYMVKEYHLNVPEQQIIDGVNETMGQYYRSTVPIKDGVKELLEKLCDAGIPCAVASVTDKELVKAALKNNGVLDYFSAVVTAADVGVGKQEPDVYLRAAELIGSRPEETLVFEDALHAIETAKRANFLIVGVYDATSESNQEAIKRLSDVYLPDFKNISPIDKFLN